MWEWLVALTTSEQLINIFRALLLVAGGFIVAKIVAQVAFRIMTGRATPQHVILIKRVVYWAIIALFFASALKQLGFSLGVLLGAAGVLSVAIGFASQTSASNLISGLFLVGERPFELGDIIQVGNITGEVLSIDLLSVKLRTYDNLFVRIPNESLIKTDMTNLTRFPIRRLDVMVRVAYHEDIARVRDLLDKVAGQNPLCLDEPEPMFLFLGFGESSLDIQYSVWAKRESFRELRNTMHEDVKTAFDAAGIEIPFPHRTLYAGSQSVPLPVKVIGTSSGSDS